MNYLKRLRSALHITPCSDRKVLRVVTTAWLALTALHVTIWAMTSVIGGVDSPWWLWFTVPAGLVIAAAWWWTTPVSDR